MAITVKDFAKTLKIPDKALIERMQKAGLSHSKSSDEITPSDIDTFPGFVGVVISK